MRRVDFLLTQARRQTENEEFSNTTGISDEELLQYVNDAQNRLLSLITATHPTVFVKESEDIAVATDQESYDLPTDVFLENKITSVEYSTTGLTRDYFKLDPATMLERYAGSTGMPHKYIRRSGKILLSPIPSSSTGTIRINYVRNIADLDNRRGKVLTVVLDDITKTITSLVLDISDSDFDSENLTEQDFYTVVDKNGIQQMVAIDVDSIDANTGIVTINSSFAYISGEAITVGDYVVGGNNSTTHSELPKICERYLIAYLAWKILKKDSSEDSFEQRNEVKSMETDIIDAFADVTDDIIYIPIIDEDY